MILFSVLVRILSYLVVFSAAAYASSPYEILVVAFLLMILDRLNWIYSAVAVGTRSTAEISYFLAEHGSHPGEGLELIREEKQIFEKNLEKLDQMPSTDKLFFTINWLIIAGLLGYSWLSI